MCQHRPQVRRVFSTEREPERFEHCIIDEVCAARDRWQQPSSPDYRIEVARATPCFVQFALDLVRAIVLLIEHRTTAERQQLLIRVANGANQFRAIVCVNANFCGSRSGINCKDMSAIAQQRSP